VHAKYFLLVRGGLKNEGGQCYKPRALIQDAEQLNPSHKSSKASIEIKFAIWLTKRPILQDLSLCPIFCLQAKNYNIDVSTPYRRHSAPTLSNPLSLSTDIPRIFVFFESFVAIMQFSLNILAILAASASVVTATQPRRYAPQAYQPQYGNTVPWTSSTCSAVYSTIMQTSTKPDTSVISTTTFKPSTWTSTRPTIIASVYTTFKPATTTLTSTATSVYVGE
jgi:hypothetical protein